MKTEFSQHSFEKIII